MVYYALYSTIALLILSNLNQTDQRKLAGVIFFLLALVAGLRHNIGADYLGYLSYYKGIGFYNFYSIEPIFGLLISFFKLFNFSYNIFLLGVSLITCYFFFISSNKLNIKYPVIFIYLFMTQYFLGGLMGQIRQALAISILLYVISTYLENDNKKLLFLGSTVSGLIHFSGFIGLLIPLANLIKKPRALIIYFFILSTTLYVFPISNLIISLFQLIDLPISETIQFYSESEKYGNNYEPGNIAILERVIVSIMSIILVLNSKCLWHRKIAAIYLLSIVITLGLRDFEILSQRLSRPIKFTEFFIFPIFFSDYIAKNKSRFLFLILLLLLLLKPYTIIRMDQSKYLPYKTFIP